MDMILAGRGIDAAEALSMGLATVSCRPPGQEKAKALAAELAALPQQCMRADRISQLQPVGIARDGGDGFRVRRPARVAAESLDGATIR